uniref:Uncharacterized protein n=1 Tax=Anguilla anguilla TaxID=7936 RepID=A0A0E9V9V1_ANGAN
MGNRQYASKQKQSIISTGLHLKNGNLTFEY